MASEIRRRQAWSAWWTTLVAHFKRSDSYTVWDNDPTKYFTCIFKIHSRFERRYIDAPFVECFPQLGSAGCSVRRRSTLSPSGWGQATQVEKQATNWDLTYTSASVMIVDNCLFCCLTCHILTNCLLCWAKCCLSPMSSSGDSGTPNASPSL